MRAISGLIFVSQVFASVAFAAPDSVLSVTGHCSREIAPDRIRVTMSAKVTDKDAAQAAKRASQQYENMRKEVRKLNLKDLKLQTANYSVNAEWDYNGNKRISRGYTATMGLETETSELDRIGDVLAIGTKLGLQDVSSPEAFLSPALSKKEYEGCLEVAVKNAKAKADKMATAAGTSVASLLTLDETKPEVQVPMYAKAGVMAENMMDAQAQRVGYEVKPINVEITIYAKYALK